MNSGETPAKEVPEVATGHRIEHCGFAFALKDTLPLEAGRYPFDFHDENCESGVECQGSQGAEQRESS